MSRRYGRQQKRHHAKRIADLEHQLAVAERTLSTCRRALAEQNREMRQYGEMIHNLSPFTLLLPPVEVSPEVADYGTISWARQQQLFYTDLLYPIDAPPLASPFTIVRVNIHELRAWIEEKRETLELAVHVRCGDRYMVSRVALSMIHQMPDAYQIIAREISRAFLRRVPKFVESWP